MKKKNKKTIKIALLIILIILLIFSLIYLYSRIGKICSGTNCNNNSQLVGGCGGVYYPYWQECCDNWAAENNITYIQCVGNWIVENNECKWVCN